MALIPLLERKAVLERAITDTPTMKKIAYIDGHVEDLWAAIVERKMEGIIAKRKDGRYHSDKRTNDFICPYCRLGKGRLRMVGTLQGSARRRDRTWCSAYSQARVKMRNWIKSRMLRSPVFVDFILST